MWGPIPWHEKSIKGAIDAQIKDKRRESFFRYISTCGCGGSKTFLSQEVRMVVELRRSLLVAPRWNRDAGRDLVGGGVWPVHSRLAGVAQEPQVLSGV